MTGLEPGLQKPTSILMCECAAIGLVLAVHGIEGLADLFAGDAAACGWSSTYVRFILISCRVCGASFARLRPLYVG